MSSREWLPKHVVMPKGTETAGMPFSLAAFPHSDGVLDAFDNPRVRRIILQWGSRLGKTTACLSLIAKVAGTNPRNMMFASSTKDAAGRVIGSRLYPILRTTDGVKDQLLPESRQSKLHVRLHSCQVFIGWSGSETSLADVGAFFGVANEIDKWDESASKEGDSLKLFVNRFKGFPDHKIIFESTPTIKGRSRIERLLNESNRHTRHCPCPHCGEYQRLVKGDEHLPGGIKWERDERGNSIPEVAFETAFYECRHCLGKIENHHRTVMLRKGVWVPDGCTVTPEGKIEGTAIKEGADTVGFGPLASWYALTETWGNFARLWINAQKKPRELQDVFNSYMGETWELRRSKSTPETVGEKLMGETPRGVVPEGGQFLTVTVDRQAADGGFVKWVVLAHGDSGRRWLVDYGMSLTLSELWDSVFRKHWPHADGGTAMQAAAGGVDSGWNTKDTYDFCRQHPGVMPIKGSSTDMSGKPYDVRRVEKAEDGIELFFVNTDYWETELQAMLDERSRNEPGSLTLCREAGVDFEMLVELCNGTLTDSVDTRGNAKLLWKKKEESVPNDFRDAIRYGLCLAAAWVDERGGVLPRRAELVSVPQTERVVSYAGDKRPDGRAWNE